MCKEYPKAIVCTNLDVNGIENKTIPFTDYEQLKTLDNGIEGIIFFLDELHILWNSLESKDIPISEMACFCQMRKNRRVIIGTSQVYSRIAKPIRNNCNMLLIAKISLVFFKSIKFLTLARVLKGMAISRQSLSVQNSGFILQSCIILMILYSKLKKQIELKRKEENNYG